MQVLIVGNRGGTNIGGGLERAALQAGYEVSMLESRHAMEAPLWLRRFNWYLRGRRPTKLEPFSAAILEACRVGGSKVLIATGVAPITHQILLRLRSRGVVSINFLTDDPWNAAHRAGWFLRALPEYSHVFSPRRANLADLAASGCSCVHYLPFGYDPSLHFQERLTEIPRQLSCDVLFIGAGDVDRIPFCRALITAGIRVALYGDYWPKYSLTRPCFQGYADSRTARVATSCAKVCLCLVRRANRDGHTMRTLEAAAMGGCLLAEDTLEHRELLGPDGQAAIYFRTIPEMVKRAKWLLANETERRRLAAAAHARITQGKNTYADRLQTMLELATSPSHVSPAAASASFYPPVA